MRSAATREKHPLPRCRAPLPRMRGRGWGRGDVQPSSGQRNKLLAILSLCLALLVLAGTPHAHDLHSSVGTGEAVVVKLYYIDDQPFSFEAYEIYREGESLPYQVGRSDALGRVVFLPDRAGEWRVKAVSEDGHGVDVVLYADAQARVELRDTPVFERYGRILVGVALILGIFGFLNLYLRKKKRP